MEVGAQLVEQLLRLVRRATERARAHTARVVVTLALDLVKPLLRLRVVLRAHLVGLGALGRLLVLLRPLLERRLERVRRRLEVAPFVLELLRDRRQRVAPLLRAARVDLAQAVLQVQLLVLLHRLLAAGCAPLLELRQLGRRLLCRVAELVGVRTLFEVARLVGRPLSQLLGGGQQRLRELVRLLGALSRLELAQPAVEGGLVIGLRLLELLPLAAQRLRRRRAQVGGCGRVARLRSELGHLRNDVRVALGQVSQLLSTRRLLALPVVLLELAQLLLGLGRRAAQQLGRARSVLGGGGARKRRGLLTRPTDKVGRVEKQRLLRLLEVRLCGREARQLSLALLCRLQLHQLRVLVEDSLPQLGDVRDDRLVIGRAGRREVGWVE
mmetsp:Transcript_14551/g.38727  ORF Transcript_14551/g.38727 Transcript_14551/m.38727 type:complete len:383 (-) Transcript_14551:739-1887(-)